MKPKFYTTLKGLFNDNPIEVKLSSSITVAEQISLGGARRFAIMPQEEFIKWYLDNSRKHFLKLSLKIKPKSYSWI